MMPQNMKGECTYIHIYFFVVYNFHKDAVLFLLAKRMEFKFWIQLIK